jgi:hypothetical protein
MRFPLLFAVPTDDSRDRASIYQATLLRDGPDRWGDTPSVYLIAPYRIFHGHNDDQWPDQAFVRRRRDPHAAEERPNHDVLLVADFAPRSTGLYEDTPARRAFYHGTWRHSGATVLSMYCSAAIPVLRFDGHGYRAPWPTARFNRLPLTPATMADVRDWVRRWDPRFFASEAAGAGGESDSEEEEAPAVPVLFPAPPPRAAAAATSVVSHSAAREPTGAAPVASTLPAFVATALVADAIARGLACPITLEPITPDTATTVTPCYHVFDADALSIWVAAATTPPACPTCKAPI